MSNKVRWGILSTGHIAHTFAKAVRHVPAAELVAVGSRSQASADKFGDEFDIPHRHPSYEALVADPEVDVIYVCTPHPLHAPCAKLALSAGKHVLCEKPFTVNLREAREVVALAREKNLFLMEAMWTRFLPSLGKAREWITSGVLGDVRLFQAAFCFRAGDDEASRLLAPEMAGGGLLDVGIYPISLASMLFGGQPQRIVSLAHLGHTGVDEQAVIIFGYGDGALASLACAVRTSTVHDAYIYGTEGYINLQSPFWSTTRAMLYKGDQMQEAFEQPHPCNGFEYQIEEVCRCVQSGLHESGTMPLDETLAIMETMDRIRDQWGLRYPGE